MPEPEPEQVRIHLAGVGGAFGGREDLSMQIHGALLALHTNRPVKIVYNREESFVGHIHRHPAKIWAEHRATRDGQARQRARAHPAGRRRVCLELDRGYVERCLVRGRAVRGRQRADREHVCLHEQPTVRRDARLRRGSVCFAHEAQMDKLADALDIDPIELRLLNALGPGGSLPTGQKITGTLPVADVIRRAAALDVPEPEELPRNPMRLPGGSGNTTRGEGVKRGVGFAVGFKNIGYSEGYDDYTAARVQLHADGSATVHCAAAEVGQGVANVILQVARTELGIERRRACPAHDRDGRLRGLGVGFADDLDGLRRRAGRVPGRAGGARAEGRAARSTSSGSTAIRARRRSTPRRVRSPASGHTSRTRAPPCASSPRSTSSWD